MCLIPACWQYGSSQKFAVSCSSVFPTFFFFLSVCLFLSSLNIHGWVFVYFVAVAVVMLYVPLSKNARDCLREGWFRCLEGYAGVLILAEPLNQSYSKAGCFLVCFWKYFVRLFICISSVEYRLFEVNVDKVKY